jgi:hypothetical protein
MSLRRCTSLPEDSYQGNRRQDRTLDSSQVHWNLVNATGEIDNPAQIRLQNQTQQQPGFSLDLAQQLYQENPINWQGDNQDLQSAPVVYASPRESILQGELYGTSTTPSPTFDYEAGELGLGRRRYVWYPSLSVTLVLMS